MKEVTVWKTTSQDIGDIGDIEGSDPASSRNCHVEPCKGGFPDGPVARTESAAQTKKKGRDSCG